MTRYLMIIMLVSIFITSCARDDMIVRLDPTAPCDVILHPALLEVPFDKLAQGWEEANAWIITEFPTTTVEFRAWEPSGDGNLGSFSWSQDDKAFDLYLTSDRKYIEQLQISSSHAMLGHILRCFGTPEYYTLEVGVPIGGSTLGTKFQVWYPDLGIIFEDASLQYAGQVRYTPDSPMRSQTMVSPAGAVEEMLQYRYGGNEMLIQERLLLLQSWPETFTELIGESKP